MLRRSLLLASLLVLPSIAVAQRGGGGGGSRAGKKDEMFDKAPKGPSLRVRDLEDLSPIKLLIDKRKDLKLSDAQVNQLKDSEGKLKDKNAPVFKMADSLLHDMKFNGDTATDVERARIVKARNGFSDVLSQLAANYDASSKDALATFDADQQAKANDLLTKQRAEGEKTVQEKLGAAPGGR